MILTKPMILLRGFFSEKETVKIELEMKQLCRDIGIEEAKLIRCLTDYGTRYKDVKILFNSISDSKLFFDKSRILKWKTYGTKT